MATTLRKCSTDLSSYEFFQNKDYSGGEGRWTVVEAPAVIPQPESFLEELEDSYRNKTVRRMSDGSTVTTIDNLPLAVLKEAVLTVAGAKTISTLLRLGTRAAPLVKIVPRIIDPNKLHHIFGKPKHNLGQVLQKFGGSQKMVFGAIESATKVVVKAKRLTGIFQTSVQVGGTQVRVGGSVVDGVVKIGTAFIP